MEAEWIEVMPEWVTLRPFVSMSPARDAPRYGDPIRFRAYVASTTKEFRGHGQTVRTAATLLIPYGPIADSEDPRYGFSIQVTPGPQDQYTIERTGASPQCLGVDQVDDDLGLHHYEIYLDAPAMRV